MPYRYIKGNAYIQLYLRFPFFFATALAASAMQTVKRLHYLATLMITLRDTHQYH